MQQIEEIRRMSELAKQLRERGLAKDSLDAFNQARLSTSTDPAVARQRQDDAMAERLALLERKVQSQQQRIDDLQRQLEQTTKKLSDYAGQMSTFSAKIRDLEIASTANIAPISAQPWNQAYPPQMTGLDKPPSTVPIDRNGAADSMERIHAQGEHRPSVAPADVSVEKFFYFGKK